MLRRLYVMLLTALFGLALVGCETQEGPAEKAGKQVDEAVEELGQKVEETGDQVRENTSQ